MNYEIVELEEKVVAGYADITSNDSPDMGAKIGALWQNLFSGQKEIRGRTNQKAIGLYCDYFKPTQKDYTILVGCQVKDRNDNNDLAERIIPGGRYAKFTLKGDVVKAVQESWMEIWNTPLDRTWVADFEEYQEDCDGKTGTIFIYIGIK